MNSFVQHHSGLIRFGYHCFDRIVCNVYIPRFYHMGSVVRFLKDRRQAAALTPAFFRQISATYHQWVVEQAQHAGIPMVDAPTKVDIPTKASGTKIRRHEWVQPYFEQLGARPGTAVILKAREPAHVVVSSRNQHLQRAVRFINLYYFYLNDPQCGPMFLRVSPYFPFNAQICLNGNEYLAQQCRRQGLALRQEDNAVVDCDQPERLQELADTLSAATINQALERALGQWLNFFTPEERAAGYRHQAFVAQVEYCDNLIFHQRAAVNRLFERLLDHNRSIGRPDKLAIIFGRPSFHPDTRTGQTHVKITRLRTPVISSSFQQTSLKQYVKSNVLLRTESASYQLRNLALRKSVEHLDKVRHTLHTSNQRYLNIQQDVLATYVDRGQLQKLRQPTISSTGRRTPGLRLEDLRLLALWQALTCFIHALGHGTFRTRDLLPEAQRVLNQPDYKLSQLRYDLGKLRGKGLVQRLPNRQCYELTSEGFRLAVFYSKIYHRLLAPLTTGILDPIPADNCLLNHREVKLDRLYRVLYEHLDRLTTFLGLAA
jgi:hypothetical protein